VNTKTLVLLFAVYIAVGTALLATPLIIVGLFMAALMPFLLGAAWPSHWAFPAAGVALGVGAAGMLGLFIFGLGLMQGDLLALVLYSAAGGAYAGVALAVWLTVMLLGMLSAWLVRRMIRRQPARGGVALPA
jgi:hypothetical protein